MAEEVQELSHNSMDIFSLCGKTSGELGYY